MLWKKTQCGGAEPLRVASVWMRTQREGETPSCRVCVERDMTGGGIPTLVTSKRKQHHSEEDLNPPCHIAISKEWPRAQTLLAVSKVEQHNKEALLVVSCVLPVFSVDRIHIRNLRAYLLRLLSRLRTHPIPLNPSQIPLRGLLCGCGCGHCGVVVDNLLLI